MVPPQQMTRAQQTLTIGVVLLSMYSACFFGVIPFPSKVQEEIVPVLPFWAFVSFGSYLLFKLGWGVFTFNDVPEAYKELMGEIQEAKKDLRKKGVDVD